MKKVFVLVLVLLLLAAVLGLRLYQNRSEKPADTAAQENAPEATPYDPLAVLDLEGANLDDETLQEVIQTEQEWAASGTGTGQLSPADTSGGMTESTENVTIDIGEGETGSLGF